MANIRQSILIRTDLNLPVGLLAAQVAHIAFEPYRLDCTGDDKGQLFDVTATYRVGTSKFEWMTSSYIFVHRVPNLESLMFFQDEATKAGLELHTWTDTIYIDISPTQKKAFKNVLVGLSLGPAESDDIKAVIGDLPLL